MSNINHRGLSRWQRVKEMLAIGCIGWIPRAPGILLRRWVYTYVLGELGRDVKIERGCEFFGAHQIKIGTHVFISHNAYLEAAQANNEIVIGNQAKLGDNIRLGCSGGMIIIADGVILDRGSDIRALDEGCVEIGQETYVGPYSCLAGPGRIKIGENCLIASHVGIYANNHNFADSTQRIAAQGLIAEGIVIEDDCWLGSGVKVLDGVTIAQGSVIGAGAVVTKSIPPWAIAVGVPAKVIGYRGEQSTSSAETINKKDKYREHPKSLAQG